VEKSPWTGTRGILLEIRSNRTSESFVGDAMKRLLVMAALAAAGCGTEMGANPPEGSPPVVLATFTGEVDMVSGTVTIQSEPTALGRALGMKMMVVPEGTPGVTVANASVPWNNKVQGCPLVPTTSTTGADVRVTSNYAAPTSLGNVYAEITFVSLVGATACNSDAAIPGVKSTNGGLWSYGNISAGANAVKTWAFTYGTGTRFTFRGQIVAFRVDAWTDRMPSVSNVGYRMAGNGASAIFVEAAANKVVLVDASGTYTESAALSAPPTGVATNADGSQIWVSLGTVNKIARLNAAGALVGTEIAVPAGNPEGITVDPISGVVWFALPNTGAYGGVGWYDPRPGANPASGTVEAFTRGGGVSPIVAVNVSGTCYLYTGTKTAGYPLRRINCTAKTDSRESFALPAACGSPAANVPLVAGANGDVWMAGTATGGTICRISGTTTITVTKEFDAGGSATFSALAYGSDSNLWVMKSGTGLCRIWLGATDRGTQTCLGALVPSTATYGIAVGAAAVPVPAAIWAPNAGATAGKSNLTRVIP
jgi:hypothetical protein